MMRNTGLKDLKNNTMKNLIVTAVIILSASCEYGPSAEEYFNRGTAKAKLEDHRGAILDFSKAIELNPKIADVYFNRGKAKGKLTDYRGNSTSICRYTNLLAVLELYHSL